MEEKYTSVSVSELDDVVDNQRNCPKCGAPLIVRNTKNGHILGCSNYPVCNYLENINIHGVKILKTIKGKVCPICGGELAVKKSKYGLFIGCLNYPECKYTVSDSSSDTVLCPSCRKGVLRQHANKYGKSFYSCSNYHNCKYKVSYKPISKVCEKCGYPILLVRVNKMGRYLQCPSAKCKEKYPYSAEQS